uniref:Uncharacterized protein n=1 Tax=Anguilla anguilla TaxID=7936 RepID=A0A0E9V5S5_ANGAN
MLHNFVCVGVWLFWAGVRVTRDTS